MKSAWIFVALLALFLFAGCIGGTKGGEKVGQPGEAVEEKVESATVAGWCARGTSWSWANPTTGERASLVIQGIVSFEGKSLCKAVWEAKEVTGGEVAKMEQYFNEDGSFTHVLYYDDKDRLTNEWRIEGEKMTMKAYDEQGKVIQEFTYGGTAPMQ